METAAGPAPPRGLPQPLTTFVGREAELRSLKALVRGSRMVTLIGTGGAGKTRLAAEVARAGDEDWPDGIFWLELAAERDAAAAMVALLELPGRGSPAKVAAAWLASRRALLVLDNCEHLVAECAELCQQLLERCLDLTILATSREALGVPGEARWPVGSLAEPDALSLFEARARLVEPAFRVAAQNRGSVSAICDRIDRLPLAIEMAAARLDLMSERELLANLDDRFVVLASSSRRAPERQQTMTATIDWSYRLLSEEERALFRRLAVFRGGFSREAAEAVCGVAEGASVLPLLSRLVQKSMVMADRVADSTRYRLLESHLVFAVDRLRESDEMAAVQRRHYEFFLGRKWSSQEAANFWAALWWSRDNLDDGGLQLAIEVADAGYSDQTRALGLLLELLKRPAAQGPARARALNLAARLTSRQGNYAASRSLADESIAAARKLKDPQVLAQVLSGAGVVYQADNKDLEAARRMFDEALALLKGSADRRLAIEIQNQAAVLATEQGDFARAGEMLRECVAYSRSQGEDELTARYLESLANVELAVGDPEGAAAHWREALATFRRQSDPFGMIWSVGGLGLVAAMRGDQQRALRIAAAVDRLSREWSLSAWPGRVHQLEDMSARAREALGAKKADDAWREGLAMSTERALDYCLGDAGIENAGVDAGPLSTRELEVAAMVAGGMTNKQIAERLFIAERTAEGHVERIRNKLGVRSRTEVATWAIARGIQPRQLDKD